MWHTESGSHASFAYLISNEHCVREHLVRGGQLGECVKVPAHTHPPGTRFPGPFGCAFTYLWAVAGAGGVAACFFFFSLFRSTLQIAFVLNCWCKRQRWAECKQGPKLFTLSRSRWRGWVNFFFFVVVGVWVLLFFFYQKLLSVIYRIYWFYLKFESFLYANIAQFSLWVAFVFQSDMYSVKNKVEEVINLFLLLSKVSFRIYR